MAEKERRRRGRPATGVTPKRNIRVGAVWDQAAEHAATDGMTMTALVTRLLATYVNSRENGGAVGFVHVDRPAAAND